MYNKQLSIPDQKKRDRKSYLCSSTSASRNGRDDMLVRVSPLLEMAGYWHKFLPQEVAGKEMKALRLHERTGQTTWERKFCAELLKSALRQAVDQYF